ncbi:MAG TPA: ABC transporter permease [Vicinamibacterales bacterium]|nr:ABC transporter permease [Vicinamibacterales bacterium]
MTGMDAAVETRRRERPSGGGSGAVRELTHSTWVIARRGLAHMRREPEALADATIQPIMFTVLFAYVFGGAIKVPDGGSYKEFLMGGIFAQTLTFSLFGTAMALASDRKNGAVDRFRSLPIPRGALLSGHAVASLLRATLPITLMSLSGLLIGWRIHSSVPEAIGGFALMFAFSFAIIWLGVLLAAAVGTPEAVQGIAFIFIFPLTFVASTFVPVSTLPEPLKTFAEWNPISAVADALRKLFENPGAHPLPSAPWPMHHPIEYSVIWIVAIVVICAPIAVKMYQRSIAS